MWHDEHNIPIHISCQVLKVARSGYYKWLKADKTSRVSNNEKIAELIKHIHEQHPDMGYRRIRDNLYRDYDIDINDKRVLRICRKMKIKSTIKYSRHSCTVNAANPQHIAENILNREFYADKPNEKWLTDVTEFKYYEGITVHKIYPELFIKH